MRFKLRFLAKALLILVGIAVLGWMVMTLWNWVIPALFIGGRSIDYLHAMGLLILSRILFGGFRIRLRGRRRRNRPCLRTASD